MLRPLYPARPSYHTGHLPVSGDHKIYYELSGNPNGLNAVFLHGGPGGSVSPSSRRFFSSEAYNLCLFDQRGCGKSEPFCQTQNNTTQDLINDIEALRSHLGIEKWLVFGGSWGSTLALAYAQSHPDRVLGLVLRGLFLGTQSEIDWFMTGPKWTHPEVWHPFADFVKETQAMPILEAYWQKLTSTDHETRLGTARSWSVYETSLATLHPNSDARSMARSPEIAMPIALLEAHYFRNKMFLEPDQLLQNLESIIHIPTVLVQGRYDVICPTFNTWRLREAWTKCEEELPNKIIHEQSNLQIQIVPDAGHASFEPGTTTALLNALDKFSTRFRS
ncbi:MAG: prolyl aminopeptidase [Alphaproteobacteria bacterium]